MFLKILVFKNISSKGMKKILTPYEENLKNRVLQALKEQGFEVEGNNLKLEKEDRETYRRVQQAARLLALKKRKGFLLKFLPEAKRFLKDGAQIKPEEISLELREVKGGSFDALLFRWWALVWWSTAPQRTCGRQLRFLLWDKTHNAPFGLITVQSPYLHLSVRDRFLELKKEEKDFWVNCSLNAQRVGALPPYNELLGGKLVALALTCNELREAYRRKYKDSLSLVSGRRLTELLFITTGSAFGRSSIYNRLKYYDEEVAISLGFSDGKGTFHFPEELYSELRSYLKTKEPSLFRKTCGPTKSIIVLEHALRHLKLKNFVAHNVKREFYLFPLVKNLKGVLHKKEAPLFYDRPFKELERYFKERYLLPRAERVVTWKNFKREEFFKEVENLLKSL